jgi:TRAP-type C4-dicarboxylate transport system permease large subunit
VVIALLLGTINNSESFLRGLLRGKIDKPAWNEAVQVNWKNLKEAMTSTGRTTALIFLIVVAAFTMSFAFARLGISQSIADWITGFGLNPIVFIIALVVFYLVLGTFMESFSMLVTTIPIIAPVLVAMGVDLVWFGIIVTVLVEAALISPPEGINLYILHGVRQDVEAEMARTGEGALVRRGTISDVWIGVLPFMICMAALIALLIAFPDIALWLPNTAKGAR